MKRSVWGWQREGEDEYQEAKSKVCNLKHFIISLIKVKNVPCFYISYA